MTIRSGLGAVRRKVLGSLYRRSVLARNLEPVVSFTFDDFPRTAYTVGGAILERLGVRGTYYAAAGLMNSSNESGEQFHSEDLDSLLEKGHELASHTFNHISSRSVSSAEFCADANKGKTAIAEIAGLESANFAYPFGHVTLRSKQALARDFASARGIFPGLNGPEIDLNLLRANRLYGDLEASARAEVLIRENVRKKAWLIFYTHDVRPQPSAHGCTPRLLEAATTCALNNGCRVLPVRDALTEVGVQNGSPNGQVQCEVTV